jgi:hypothetical protein
MSRSFWQDTATHAAESFVKGRGIETLPVCPFSIAKDLDIDVRPLPRRSHPGVSGMLLRQGNAFGILYATYLDNDGFQRFSIGHELGHYHLPSHPESVLRDGFHTSYAGFTSKDRYELEADHFAAGLLMPGFLFDPAMDKVARGLDAIEALSDQCVTSRTATAIRYAQRTPDAVAIVVSAGHVIDYCFMSDSFREIPGLDWLRKGSPLPHSSVTHSFNSNTENIARGERADGEQILQNWFGGHIQAELFEEVVGLGSYGRTLTVLTASDLPDLEEIEEEEELRDSWEPRFKR